jgi:hypothetical protein
MTKRLNFSQRNGFEKVDNILQINSMNNNLRTALYNFVYKNYIGSYYFAVKKEVLYDEFFKKPLIYLPNSYDGRQEFNEWFSLCDWYKIYDFFEFCFSKMYINSMKNFVNSLNFRLREENSGYKFVVTSIHNNTDSPSHIIGYNGFFVPITDKYELEEVENALNSDELYTNHLGKAAEYLRCRNGKEPDYRNSIKESISAAEAVVRVKTEESTLRKGIEKLEKKGVKINKRLKDAFLKLYDYTNSKSGIRHALMDEETVSLAEAKFMLVACSAFINYLKLSTGTNG